MSGRTSAETAIDGSRPASFKLADKNEAVKGDGESSENGIVVTSAPKQKVIYDPSQESIWTRLGLSLESFKRAPGSTRGQVVHGSAIPDADAEAANTDNSMLQQTMKNRHLNMIAVGGSIGTGLFIGSGSALHTGGPLALIVAWTIMGVMLLNTCQAIGELSIMYPVTGGFYTLISRFVDQSWGFANGWNYWLQWVVTLPLELTAAAFTIQFWDTDGKVSIAVYITIFAVIIGLLNLFGTYGFAEEEFWSSCLKLAIIFIFLISALVFVLGGGPSSGDFGSYYGAKNWHDPGPLANGFHGICAVFVTAAFSFAGTELVGLAATEHPNPRQALPAAIKMTFWRINILFILSLIMVGFVVRYDDERLVGGSYDANTSPFVLAFKNANVSGLPDLINATILVSILSIGMASVYAASRTLMALAEQGYAPKIFAYVDKAGRPSWSVLVVFLFYPLAYINLSPDVGTQVFNWLLAISGLATIFTWLSINIAHIRFRQAWKAQGHHIDELPFRAMFGVWGSVLSAVILVLVLIAQFYIAIWPVGGTDNRAESFFLSYLAAPICILFYLIGVAWKRTRPLKVTEIDLVTGRKCWETAEELNAWRTRTKAWPMWKRIIHALFQ